MAKVKVEAGHKVYVTHDRGHGVSGAAHGRARVEAGREGGREGGRLDDTFKTSLTSPIRLDTLQV